MYSDLHFVFTGWDCLTVRDHVLLSQSSGCKFGCTEWIMTSFYVTISVILFIFAVYCGSFTVTFFLLITYTFNCFPASCKTHYETVCKNFQYNQPTTGSRIEALNCWWDRRLEGCHDWDDWGGRHLWGGVQVDREASIISQPKAWWPVCHTSVKAGSQSEVHSYT